MNTNNGREMQTASCSLPVALIRGFQVRFKCVDKAVLTKIRQFQTQIGRLERSVRNVYPDCGSAIHCESVRAMKISLQETG